MVGRDDASSDFGWENLAVTDRNVEIVDGRRERGCQPVIDQPVNARLDKVVAFEPVADRVAAPQWSRDGTSHDADGHDAAQRARLAGYVAICPAADYVDRPGDCPAFNYR